MKMDPSQKQIREKTEGKEKETQTSAETTSLIHTCGSQPGGQDPLKGSQDKSWEDMRGLKDYVWIILDFSPGRLGLSPLHEEYSQQSEKLLCGWSADRTHEPVMSPHLFTLLCF